MPFLEHKFSHKVNQICIQKGEGHADGFYQEGVQAGRQTKEAASEKWGKDPRIDSSLSESGVAILG